MTPLQDQHHIDNNPSFVFRKCPICEHSRLSPTPLSHENDSENVQFKLVSDRTKFVEMSVFAGKEDMVFTDFVFNNVYEV